MKAELRLTDTNAASDSKGRTWGLEGGLFWWLVGGIGAGITVFFVFLVILKSSLLTSLGVALVPVGLVPRLHLRPAAGQTARLRPRHLRARLHGQRFRPGSHRASRIHSRRTSHEPLHL